MRGLPAIAAMVLFSLALAAPAVHAAADGPRLVLSKDTAKLGDSVGVTGSGFPIGAQVQVEICGTGGSSNSCAIAAAVNATADAHGGFRQTLSVVEPPTPCPCTVHAAPYAGTAADPADTPISIPGLRYLPQAAPVAVGTAELMDATVVPDSPFLTQFGADGSARVTLTFADLAGGPAPDPGVTVTLSRAGAQVGSHPVAWTGGALAVGGRRSLIYELSLPGGWFRAYQIGVELGSPANGVTVRTLSATVRPWGELLAPSVLLFGLGCLMAARRRGTAVPEPFPAVPGFPAPTPELENATAETPETAENGPSLPPPRQHPQTACETARKQPSTVVSSPQSRSAEP